MKKEEKSTFNILSWLDNNILAALAGLLLVFIPLYPKLPLLEAIPGYIVRIRLEDILISFTILIWLIWLIRGKISLKDNPLFKPIGLYLIIGFLSVLSALFVIKTVPLELIHIEKIMLHYIRRIEYFSLFFILFSVVKRPKDIKKYIYLLAFAVIGVTIYGFGQKYLYWPAFSTMNREFAKGWLLYLTEHSRVLSTFGGHYDLAAYIMMALTIGWSLFFGIRNRFLKISILIVLSAAFWLLILTASRTSFLAYLGGVSIVIILWVFKRNLSWMFSRWFLVVFLSIFIMLSFGDLSERFTKLLRIDQRLGGLKEVLLRPATNPPGQKAVFLVNNLQAVTSKSDQPLTPYKPGEQPFDVVGNIPEPIPLASDSSQVELRPRTYSQTALQYDLSTGIRLDALWPRAIAGFLRNPLLGSGYSTLTKTQITEFTEAESTDNDFLRMLGETGLLGTIAFLAIIITIVVKLWKGMSRVKDPFIYALSVGAIGISLGLLINAVYIDVFEASKVAYSYWALMGLILGGVKLYYNENERNNKPLRIPFDWQKTKKSFIAGITSDKFLLILILLVAFYLRLYKIDSPVADWHSWRQADTASVTRNYEQGSINLLYPIFDDLSSIPSGKQNPRGLRMVEFPLYNAVSVMIKKIIPEGPLERSMRLTSIFASLGSIIFIFLLVRQYSNRRTAFIASIIYGILPYNIFYNRTILPETSAVFLSLAGLYFFDVYLFKLKEKSLINKVKYFLLTFLFCAAGLLVKPMAVFLLIPSIYLVYRHFSWKFIYRLNLLLLFILIITPFLLWRWWINHFPEGIPAYTWLLNGDSIRFKGAFFYWLFAERIGKLILGYWGLPLLLLGLLIKPRYNEGWLYRWFGIGSLLYLFIFATGNVRHDYYQIFIIPTVTIFIALGIDYLLSFKHEFSKITSLLVVCISIIFMEAFGWYQVRDYFNINHPEIVKAGEAVQKLTRKKGLVIAPYNGDTAFLYQTGRSGWPIIEGSIDELISKGADYYVSVNFDSETKRLMKISLDKYNIGGYKILEKTDEYVVMQIVPDKKLPKD